MLQEVLRWIRSIVAEFGTPNISTEQLADYINKTLSKGQVNVITDRNLDAKLWFIFYLRFAQFLFLYKLWSNGNCYGRADDTNYTSKSEKKINWTKHATVSNVVFKIFSSWGKSYVGWRALWFFSSLLCICTCTHPATIFPFTIQAFPNGKFLLENLIEVLVDLQNKEMIYVINILCFINVSFQMI